MRKEKAHRRFSFGGVAQLGEHLFCKQKVAGSIPVASIYTSEEEQQTHPPVTREIAGAAPVRGVRETGINWV